MNLEEIKARYSEAHRYYHTWDHIEYMFCVARENGVEIKEKTALWYAIVYHDIIYDPKANDNEEESGYLLIDTYVKEGDPLIGIKFLTFNVVRQYILATKHKDTNIEDYEDTLKILLDLDLAILGDTWEVYQDYVSKIRKEYSHLSDEEFNAGRKDWLSNMLARESIYYTDWGKKRELQARENLKIEFVARNTATYLRKEV